MRTIWNMSGKTIKKQEKFVNDFSEHLHKKLIYGTIGSKHHFVKHIFNIQKICIHNVAQGPDFGKVPTFVQGEKFFHFLET